MQSQTTKREPKPKKIEAVNLLNDKVGRARAIYFTEFKGMTVAEISDLRRKCYKSHVDYLVSKNTFARRVMKDHGYEDALKHLVGPTAIAFGYDDPAVAAKILFEFSSKNDKLVLKGGIFERKLISAKDIEAIKDLPSREQALSLLLAAINGPIQGFYNVVNAVLRDFVSVIDQIAEKKQAA
jgi:large subunit ribosomal protein L10